MNSKDKSKPITATKSRKNNLAVMEVLERVQPPEDSEIQHNDVLALALELAQAMAMDGGWSSRQDSAGLRLRMAAFNKIYNACWHVRYHMHGLREFRQQAIQKLWITVAAELKTTTDHEALLYAIVDGITCGPHRLPWKS
jgi:hypothetical protein